MTNKLQTPPGEPAKLRQFFAAIIANIIAISYGTIIGWASPIIPQLLAVDTPIGGEPLTSEQVSWLNSVMCISGLATLPFCSFIIEKLGRKLTGCLVAIPFGLCWLMVLFASNFTWLLFGRLFSGVGAALGLVLVPLYVTEIADDSIRGQLGSFMVFAVNIGIFLAYLAGAVLSYHVLAICGFLILVVFLGCFVFMPETPVYLVRKDRTAQAIRSLMWLKNDDKVAVDLELLKLQAITKTDSSSDKSVGFRHLFRDKGTIRGLAISIALLGGQQTCGISAVVMYTASIFQLAGSSMLPNTATIVVGGIQVFGSFLSSMMMERAGRRLLILISCAGMAVCHVILGIFLWMQAKSFDVSSFSWIPVCVLSVFAIVYCLGMGPAPFIVSAEVFSADISGYGVSVGQVAMWVMAFVVVKFFPSLTIAFGMHGCFFLLACCCICTFVFTFFVIPETKGRTIESILDELNGCPKNLEASGYIKASCGVTEKNDSSFAV